MSTIFSELSKPFPSSDIEWRIQQSGENKGRVWAMALAYVTNRAIQNRLDTVCGPMGWKNEFIETAGGVMCGISIWCSDKKEWITKYDGAEKTDIEAMKGGLSGSMKRAAVQWGIGRYLYKLESAFVDCFTDKSGKNRGTAINKQTKQKTYFTWNPPRLPDFALPDEEKQQQTHQQQYPATHQPQTPVQANPEPVQSSSDNYQGYGRQQQQRRRKQPANQIQGSNDFVTPEQVGELKKALTVSSMDEQALCRAAGVQAIGLILNRDFIRAKEWIRKKAMAA